MVKHFPHRHNHSFFFRDLRKLGFLSLCLFPTHLVSTETRARFNSHRLNRLWVCPLRRTMRKNYQSAMCDIPLGSSVDERPVIFTSFKELLCSQGPYSRVSMSKAFELGISIKDLASGHK